MRLSCFGISDDQFITGTQVGVEEIVRRNSAVNKIGPRQVRTLLELSETSLNCRDQRNGEWLAYFRLSYIRKTVRNGPSSFRTFIATVLI